LNIKKPISFVLGSTNHGTMIVNRNDFHQTKNGAYGVGFQILNSSSFDQPEVDLALRLIQKRRQYFNDGVVALDCGANIGVHSIEWAKIMTGWGEVFSFEAQEKIFYALAGNVAINNCFNVTAKHVALGSKVGVIEIPQPNYHQPSSFGSLELVKKNNNEFIGQDINYKNTKDIDMISIDSLNIERIDFMKIDVEGMEEEVLSGAVKSIESNMPILLIEHLKSDKDFLLKFLKDRNYKSFMIGINILAINKKDPILNDVSFSDGVFKL